MPAAVAARCDALIELETAQWLATKSATKAAGSLDCAAGENVASTTRVSGGVAQHRLDPGMFNVTAAGTITLFHRGLQRGELICGSVIAAQN